MHPRGDRPLDQKGRRLWIRIADITISLTSGDPALALGVQGAAEAFLVDEADPDVSVSAQWTDLGQGTIGDRVFDSGGLWQLYHEDGGCLFRFTSSALGSAPYKTARFNPAFTSGEVFLHRHYFDCAQPLYPLEYPLDELLLVNVLARGRGAEVHACGVVDRQANGLLFVGQSGAGKTTMARLWKEHTGATILSDDRIVLRQLDAGLWMYGTPWHGEADLACPARGRLRAIFFLRQWPGAELAPVGKAEAAARLFACSFPPFYSQPGLDFTLRFFAGVAKTVPCYELRFRPDEETVGVLTSHQY